MSGAKDDIEWRLEGIFFVTEAHQSEKGGFRFFVGILAAKGIERARVELSSDEVLAALYSWIRVTVMSDAKG
ncbi:MAG: hypothetical protein AB1490_18100 [Pseudomonadota bacterium]